jgi:hypothetical protein
LIRGRSRQREVEENKLEPITLADVANAKVVRFDIAVRNALCFQPVDGFEKVISESVQELDVQSALVAKPVRQRAIASLLQHKDGATADLRSFVQVNNVLMMEFFNDLTRNLPRGLRHGLLAVLFFALYERSIRVRTQALPRRSLPEATRVQFQFVLARTTQAKPMTNIRKTP